ncbi:MAG: Abi family protein [Erysipelotrichia bacterium]|nr:Abi family protein [Erysipelotrichia bacterium]NCC55347.1 Abi family protein [Erysipelotrichia bacterium]
MIDFKTFEEQIEILKSRKLIISDEADALEKLKAGNYYNIINGYKTPFINMSASSEEFKTGVTFDEIYNLYLFDSAIRSIIFKSILQVENTLRTQISYVFSKHHNSPNYLCYSNFETLLNVGDEKPINDRAAKIHNLISKIQQDISNSIKYKHYIKHYVTKHGYVPLWVLVNAIPLNRLSRFYRLMNQNERIEVSMYWNVMEKDLRQYITKLANYRNLCAHDERIYCSKDDTPLPDSYIHSRLNICKDRNNNYLYGKTDLFSLLIALKMLLPQKDFIGLYNKINDRIISLSTKLNSISINTILEEMGFPQNWGEIKTS